MFKARRKSCGNKNNEENINAQFKENFAFIQNMKLVTIDLF